MTISYTKPTSSQFQDLTGKRFGFITVQSFHSRRGVHPYWNCLCDCGGTSVVCSTNLKTKHTISCGCYHPAVRVHGNARKGAATFEYRAWQGMKARCNNPKAKFYADYGGRGIKVCDRWSQSFETFLIDMGRKPTPKHSLDRINNDGDYTPLNCRWATKLEQSNNTRAVTFVIWGGEKISLPNLCRLMNRDVETIRKRLKKGMTIEEAFATAFRKSRSY